MLTNPRADRVRSVRALSRRAVRSRTELFLAEGPQAVREAVRHTPERVVDLYATEAAAQRHPQILAQAQAGAVPVTLVTDEVLAAMADTDSPAGLLAVCRTVGVSLERALARPAGPHTGRLGGGVPMLGCVLAHVRDPGNAGTVIRAADAAGADLVVVSDASVDVHNPKVVRSTAGSLFHLPIVTGAPLEQTLPQLRRAGIRLLAADAHGTRGPAEVDLTTPHAWVFGNEAWGLPPEVAQQCDDVVRLPIYGQAESLNLAMAATVCLYASAQALAGR